MAAPGAVRNGQRRDGVMEYITREFARHGRREWRTWNGIMCQSNLPQTVACGWYLLAVAGTQVLLADLFVVTCRLLLETILRMGPLQASAPLRLALLASVDEVAGDWQA